MNIQNVSNQQNKSFGASLVIKTEDAKLLTRLAQANVGFFEKQGLFYDHLPIKVNVDGFFHGLLADGGEAKIMQGTKSLIKETPFAKKLWDMYFDARKYFQSSSGTVTISTLDELLDLPMLRGCKEQLRNMKF